MRIDVVSIFPGYLAPLELSLVGRARASGLLDIHVHDLRGWAHDRHGTVDDAPYGGGPGMVMRPEPWGEALDHISSDGAAADPAGRARPTLLVPTPSGTPLTQPLARRLSTRPWLVVGCGRYEGIDQRVLDHAATRMDVVEVSVGDYVLNGGEAAALVLVEAVARLLPGFVGNPDSLAEESHDAGLLEYPLYTRPPVWRGLSVPDVLVGGDHERVAAWRQDQATRRTAQRRPDLLHPSRTLQVGDVEALVRRARPADVPEIFTLQRACWLQEAVANDTLDVPVLHESAEQLRASLEEWTTFVVHSHGRLVGGGRGRLDGETWHVGRLMVAPDLQGRGIGRWLLEYVEAAAPPPATAFTLFTGRGSRANLRMYRRAGYRPVRDDSLAPGEVRLSRPRRDAG